MNYEKYIVVRVVGWTGLLFTRKVKQKSSIPICVPRELRLLTLHEQRALSLDQCAVMRVVTTAVLPERTHNNRRVHV